MASKLAAQLSKKTSLNASLLIEKSRRRGREADLHDLHSIHALGVNGFIQLKSLNHSLRKFEDSLFSDAIKDVDRTLLNAEANTELDRNIEGCLRLLGPNLLEGPTGKVLEWLVRRFRCV
jgi:U3 small nucleolar RNA-associated protein 10